jgi:hypothetical protein
MKFLQGLNLTDAKGNITLAKVQTAIGRLDDQIAAAGVKAGKSVTTVQRDALLSIRDDLLRATNIGKGMPIGSSTVKNLIDQQRLGFAAHVGPGTLRGIGAAAGGVLGGLHSVEGAGAGAFAGEQLGGLLGRNIPDINALLRAGTQQKLENLMLHPSSYSPSAGTGATNLFPGGVPPHVVPLAVIAKNRLLHR